MDRVASRISLRQKQLLIPVNTKTKDNVFVDIAVVVQYAVKTDNVKDAYYKLEDVDRQMSAYVLNEVRAKVPGMTLDEIFERKSEVADVVKENLAGFSRDFGYDIREALITDIAPDTKVAEAMNQINAAARMREATIQKADAEKITRVKAAEAEAESKKLQGIGIAGRRKAIVDGLRESIKEFKDTLESEVDAKEVMAMIMMTQYFDTMKELGANSHSSTIFMPSSPSGMPDLLQQILAGLKGGISVAHAENDKPSSAVA